MPNVIAALPNIGGALCSTPQSSSLTKDSREFQARAAAAGTERSPRVRRRVAWNNQCRRDSRAQATAGTAAGCQMQGLGEVPWRCTMKASESHNIEPKLYPVRNSQPMEFHGEADWCVLTVWPRIPAVRQHSIRTATVLAGCQKKNHLALNYSSRPYWPPVLESRSVRHNVVSNAARYGSVAVSRNLLWRQQRHNCVLMVTSASSMIPRSRTTDTGCTAVLPIRTARLGNTRRTPVTGCNNLLMCIKTNMFVLMQMRLQQS